MNPPTSAPDQLSVLTRPVWERFLTNEDRQLATRQQRPHTGLGTAPALILIDLYERVFGDRPLPLVEAIDEWPSSCGLAGWNALPRITHLLATARELELPVVHVTGDPDMPSWRSARGGQRTTPEEVERGFRIMEDVAPRESEPVIRKSSPSAFFGTPLEGLLRQWKVNSLIVAGESTSGCVRATVVDGRSHRFTVTVAEDGVFDRTEAAHAINLFDMSSKYADVRTVDAVVTELRSRSEA